MELKHIKELMAVMQRTGTKRLVIKREGVELELERETRLHPQPVAEPIAELLDENSLRQELAQHRTSAMLARSKETPSGLIGAPNSASKPSGDDSNSLYVTSPMVGTFYSATSPEEPPLIKVGDRIDKNKVVCIIEAMKVMNEIKAGVSGIVAEVLVSNAHPVEFGTRLFRITPPE